MGRLISSARFLAASRAFRTVYTCQSWRSISCSSSCSLGSVLVLSNLYPQPSASAAGVRTSYILDQLCKDDDWTSIHYGTGATPESSNFEVKRLATKGVKFHSIPPNQSSKMKQLLDEIQDLSLVIFDRYYAEEAYSFHVYNHWPDAVRVVDMQDFHSLRHGRKKIFESSMQDSKDSLWDCIGEALHHVPSNQDEMLLRELASLHRSDLSLVCSPHEYNLLTETYNIPSSKLCMAPFWVSNQQRDATSRSRGWEERKDFVFIGNFRHPPNADAVQQLARHVWPRIRQELSEAQLHVYGAFCTPAIQKLHDPHNGFLVHGFVDRLKDGLADKRVMLVPLRYGAGIKGKIIDAWTFGLPVVMTSVACEGILTRSSGASVGGGVVADALDDFVEGAIRVYANQQDWEKATKNIGHIMEQQFSERQFTQVSSALKNAVRTRDDRRRDDYFGPLLWHQTTRSTEYFSRWIECKESKPE